MSSPLIHIDSKCTDQRSHNFQICTDSRCSTSLPFDPAPIALDTGMQSVRCKMSLPCIACRNVSNARSVPHASLCACSPASSCLPHLPDVFHVVLVPSSLTSSRIAPHPIHDVSVKMTPSTTFLPFLNRLRSSCGASFHIGLAFPTISTRLSAQNFNSSLARSVNGFTASQPSLSGAPIQSFKPLVRILVPSRHGAYHCNEPLHFAPSRCIGLPLRISVAYVARDTAFALTKRKNLELCPRSTQGIPLVALEARSSHLSAAPSARVPHPPAARFPARAESNPCNAHILPRHRSASGHALHCRCS
eukprot:3738391-Rhodomonas_salina.1